MADELDGLLARVDDPALRADLHAHIDRIRAKRTFGLVFESHLPERVRLPEHPIRPGAKVAWRDDPSSATYQVLRARAGNATVRKVRHLDGSRLSAEEDAEVTEDELPVADLVVIADFGEPIYPGLRALGSIDRGADKPAHLVIKGENHHVLEALQFTHAGTVGCIYIDPPYNTGARDWKYDNRYVDDADVYRHSKWLAFMERRLLLAKELLNPERSVLIVTIDEKECLRLGLLLEQTFPDARIQMIDSVINPKGATRGSAFGRTDEYIFFVMTGEAAPVPLPLDGEWKVVQDRRARGLRWAELLRAGSNTQRADRPNQFYPVFIRDTEAGPTFVDVGAPYYGDEKGEISPPEGCVAVWPIRSNGSEGNWQLSAGALRTAIDAGYTRLGRWRGGSTAITYLKRGEQRKVEQGVFPIVGRKADGSIVVDESNYAPVFVPGTQWRISSHNAEQGGTNLLKQLTPNHSFPFPKSVYAVEDALRFFIKDDPGAIVLDFFGGSGTTTHAVARLNRQDGGRRQSIVVTNNEVSAAEAESLRKQSFRPGDQEWEALGIFEHVTRPRVTAAITGLTPDGEPVKGDYKFTDEFPMADGFEENVTFAELVYLDPDDVELDLAFVAVAPLLWLRAGAQGPVIDECLDAAGRRKPYAWTDGYGVLFNPDRWRSFVEKLPETATNAFVVTDSQAIFAGVAAELPDHLDVVRLYENYLTTFRINEGLG